MRWRKTALGITSAAVVASGYIFSERSRLNLSEVHPDLQAVSECAIRKTKIDFAVIDGMRTEEEHRINRSNGRSWALRSRHQDGLAIDFAAYVDGKITFDPKYYPVVAQSFNDCSLELGIPIIWGGVWKVRDYGHIELDRSKYP